MCDACGSITEISSIANLDYVDLVCINIQPFNKDIISSISKIKNVTDSTRLFCILPPNISVVMECLSLGMDDYILRNSYTECSLECRILKLLTYSYPCSVEIKSFGTLCLLPHKREAYIAETRIKLSNFEYTFLNYTVDRNGMCNINEFQEYLTKRNGKSVSKSTLVVYVNRLKKKMAYQTTKCRIKSKYGLGYYIVN